MESDQPPAEASDDPKPSSTTTTTVEEQPQTTTQAPRSYECNFCKRGFTNAQALGGHMNIHRKDKGKFKHSSPSSTTPPHAAAESPSPTRPRLSATTTTTTTNPFSISHQGNWFSNPQLQADEKKQPLPLFGHNDAEVLRNIHQPVNPPSPDREVDLELRLGHVEPPSESSSENKATTTRKFF
ncbi:hypothetical protein LXL04_017848 [Taraxacum kok-saghyz]